jgi:hypothetical protein
MTMAYLADLRYGKGLSIGFGEILLIDRSTFSSQHLLECIHCLILRFLPSVFLLR